MGSDRELTVDFMFHCELCVGGGHDSLEDQGEFGEASDPFDVVPCYALVEGAAGDLGEAAPFLACHRVDLVHSKAFVGFSFPSSSCVYGQEDRSNIERVQLGEKLLSLLPLLVNV